MKSKSPPDTTKTEKVVTVVATQYVQTIVPDLLSKSFEAYKQRDFNSRNFQVSTTENTNATAAIVLGVLSIEAYRNRIFYLEKERVGRNVAQDLSRIINEKGSRFPKQKFQDILTEVFVIRDVIAHNHIYEVKVSHNKDYEMLGHRQKLLEGYGDKKFLTSLNLRTRKTKLLKFNIQPAKIGFEDLYTLLAFFDLFVAISQKVFGARHVPFSFLYKPNREYELNLSKILACYYEQIPNKKYLEQFDNIVKDFKNEYSVFLDSSYGFGRKCVVCNFCPNCGAFGFYKPNNCKVCNKCKFEIPVKQYPRKGDQPVTIEITNK